MKKRIKDKDFEGKNLNSLGILALSNRVKIEMTKHGISIKQLSKLTTINKNTIQAWYDNDGSKIIDIDVLSIICCVLSKKIDDFLK